MSPGSASIFSSPAPPHRACRHRLHPSVAGRPRGALPLAPSHRFPRRERAHSLAPSAASLLSLVQLLVQSSAGFRNHPLHGGRVIDSEYRLIQRIVSSRKMTHSIGVFGQSDDARSGTGGFSILWSRRFPTCRSKSKLAKADRALSGTCLSLCEWSGDVWRVARRRLVEVWRNHRTSSSRWGSQVGRMPGLRCLPMLRAWRSVDGHNHA